MTRPLRVLPPTADPLAVFAALREALGGGPALHVGEGEVPAEVEKRVALVVRTSGSTADPKLVALSTQAVLSSASGSEAALGAPGQWLLALPVSSIAGLNVLTRSVTSALGLPPVAVEGERFTVEGFAAASARLEAPERFTSLVPAQLARLLADDRGVTALRSFRRILVGGQATPEALVADARRRGVALTLTYGATETCGGCVYDGVPFAGTHVRVVDGEVQLGGPTLAEGYLGRADATAAAFVADASGRWYRTSDAGSLDDGVLSVTGRLDDVIVSGGVNVSLAALERVVRGMPGLADSVAVAVPSAEWGQSPVVVTAGHPVDEAAIRAAVADALGAAARPVRVVRVADLPLTATGKPDRRVLAALALE
jgi:O-succinylbenzoic acid--CoA ligase